jgi:polyhydroxyalkanoate synthesis regulator phasin
MGKVDQTAVDFLISELTKYGYIIAPSFGHAIVDELIKKAKEMQKQQHEETALSIAEILLDKLECKNSLPSKELFEQYYTETYGK